MLRSQAMTIGQLSRRTGVPIKALREYERLGFLYTLGRSESNYRLFAFGTAVAATSEQHVAPKPRLVVDLEYHPPASNK